MGYAAEAATWRNSYLTAAAELRATARPLQRHQPRGFHRDVVTDPDRALLKPWPGTGWPSSRGQRFEDQLALSDTKESFVLWIENAVLHFRKAARIGCQCHLDADQTHLHQDDGWHGWRRTIVE